MAAKTLGVLIYDVIEREPQIQSSPFARMDLEIKKEILFSNVTFKYPTTAPELRPTLQAVNFRIKAGQTTAIVGASGGGKSTIVQLIQRFYDLDSGEGSILFDNVDIKDIDLKVLRGQIGYVSQEPILIMGTIRENLLYGNSDATEE